MKKKNLLFVLPLVSMLLSGCDFFDKLFGKKSTYKIEPTITGGTADEKEAILKAINSKPICYTSSNPRTTIYIDKPFNLQEDEGHNVFLVRKQTIKGKVVNIEWKVDSGSSNPYAGTITPVDDIKDLMEINYKGYNQPAGKLTWSIKKISCGGASATNDKKLVYTKNVTNSSYKHDDVTIADIYEHGTQPTPYKVNIGTKQYRFPSTLKLMDYKLSTTESATYSPYFITNNPGSEKEYYYVNVKGKLLYAAPDGNWGLIANGTDVMEIYAGAGTKIKKENFPALANQYICVSGNVSQYKGNLQIGFITKISTVNASEVAPVPANLYEELTDSKLLAIKNPESEGWKSDDQFAEGIPNSLREVTGRIKLDTLKDGDGNKISSVSALSDNRFTFEIETEGGNRVIVAYDYHVHRETSTNLFEEFKSKLVDNAEVTVKGTMRYSGNDECSFVSLLYKTGVKYEDDGSSVPAEQRKTAEQKFNEAVASGLKHFLRDGDDFNETTVWDASATYYTRTDENEGARWNIVPFESGHIANAA